jgi:hypothetical protein
MRASPMTRPRVLAAVLATTVAAALCSCSASVQEAASDVVPANPAQFAAAVSIAVTTGSSGIEGSSTEVADSWWWLSATHATITITNNRVASPDLVVTATVLAPSCLKRAEIIPPSGKATRLAVPTNPGIAFRLPLNIPAGTAKQVQVVTTTAPCHVPKDSRALYVQFRSLTVAE